MKSYLDESADIASRPLLILTGSDGGLQGQRGPGHNQRSQHQATSSCPGIRVRPATTTVPTTAKHALKSRACAPLSNSPDTKGHTARSCHPLPDSLPSSSSVSSSPLPSSFSSPQCPLPDHQSQSLSTPHLLRHQCRAAICHPGTRRCHPAGRLPYTAVMASGSPRKISNQQKT